MRARVFAAVSSVAVLVLAGCGGGGPAQPEDVQLASTEQRYAAGIRGEIDSLADSYRQEGLGGLKTSLQGTMEDLEYRESTIESAGQYRETCEKIIEGLRELNVTVQSNPGQVQGKLAELQELAEKLPASGLQESGTSTPPQT